MSVPCRRIRVHHLIDSLTWGGAEMLLADLAAGAAHGGIDMTVGYLLEIDGSPAARRLRAQGVEPVHVPVGRLLDPLGLPRLRGHLAAVKPDILHTHLGFADTIGPAVARSLRIPAVSTVHLIAGAPTRTSTGTRREEWRTRLSALSRRYVASRVITVSDAAREAYLATGWDLPRRVVTVHNGVSRPNVAHATAVRSELGLDADAVVLTTVSVLREGKGHEVVIEAVRRLRVRFPMLHLLILGEGPARAQIASHVRELGTGATMLGHRDDVMSVLAATDIVLHATQVDAFPTALLESGAAGVPTIATRVGGIPEILEHEVTGLLIEPPPSVDALEAALLRLLHSRDQRREMGLNARRRYQGQFSAEAWADRLRVVYDEVLGDRR